MAKGTTVDLAQKPSNTLTKLGDKPYYPTISINETGDVKPEKGDSVIIKGVIKSCTDSEDGYSCVVEAHEMTCDCGGDLGDALDKIAKKKSGDTEDAADESDPMDDEGDEGE